MSNSSSTSSADSFSEIFDNSCLNFSINVGICCFLAILFRPLYRFALNGRYFMLIIISKAICTFLLCAFLSLKYGSNLLMIGCDHFWDYLAKCIKEPLIACERIHMLCLAINRAHCFFFPFHYYEVMNQRAILICCALCWTIPIVLMALHLLNIMEPPNVLTSQYNTRGISPEDLITDGFALWLL